MNKRLEKIVAKLQSGNKRASTVRRDQIRKAIEENAFDYFIKRSYDEVYPTEPQKLSASINDIESYWLNDGNMWSQLHKDTNMLEITINYGYSYMELWASIEDKKEESTITEVTTEPTQINNIDLSIDTNLAVTITYNTDKNGIELKFNEKPSEEIRRSMKSNGFQWGGKNKPYWYAKNTEERKTFANDLVNIINNIDTVADETIDNVEIIGELEEVETEQTTNIIPISIENIENQDIRVQGTFARLNKNSTIERYKEEVKRDSYISTCKITDIVILSNQDYEIFTHNFLKDYDFISGKGGGNEEYIKCILIQAENKESILIDPEGHTYARYVAFINEEIKQDKTPIKTKTNVININKVIPINSNISIPTNTTPPISDTNSTLDTSTLTTDKTPEQVIKQLFKDAMNEVIEEKIKEQTSTFKHEIKYKQAKVFDFNSYKRKKA